MTDTYTKLFFKLAGAILFCSVIFSTLATAQPNPLHTEHTAKYLNAMAEEACTLEGDPLSAAEPVSITMIMALLGDIAIVQRPMYGRGIENPETIAERRYQEQRGNKFNAQSYSPPPCQAIPAYVSFCDSIQWSRPICSTVNNAVNACVSQDNFKPISGQICLNAQYDAINLAADEHCKKQTRIKQHNGTMFCGDRACRCHYYNTKTGVEINLDSLQLKEICANPEAKVLFTQCHRGFTIDNDEDWVPVLK